MEVGTRMSISRPTIALDVVAGKSTIVMIPRETMLVVVAGYKEGDRMVRVHWDSRVVEMFTVDLLLRGVEVQTQSTGLYKTAISARA